MERQITRECPILETPRVTQARGLFDLPSEKTSRVEWTARLPLEERPWQIGLIVGPSGCGKSTLLRELFSHAAMTPEPEWPAGQSVLDGFPEALGIQEITGLLSRVGFSSPPSWLRPFAALSNGEQFRVNLARQIAEARAAKTPLLICDEFTSVVDRVVARVGACAVAKAIRETAAPKLQFVAASCHYDILEWLAPDWLYDPAAGQFSWRALRRRPAVQLLIQRSRPAAWELFRRHHYLDSGLHRSAKCFAAYAALSGEAPRLAAFAAALPFPHPKLKHVWREHRCVCLPDFQGLGIGHAVSEFVAAVFRAARKIYRSTTSHPAMIAHRRRSPMWRMVRAPGLVRGHPLRDFAGATNRMSAGFQFIGAAADAELARGLLPEFFIARDAA